MILFGFGRFVESQNQLSLSVKKRPLRSSSNINPVLLSGSLNHALKGYNHVSSEYLQGIPWQPVPKHNNPFGEEMFLDIQFKPRRSVPFKLPLVTWEKRLISTSLPPPLR